MIIFKIKGGKYMKKIHQVNVRLPEDIWEFLATDAMKRRVTVPRRILDLLIRYMVKYTKNGNVNNIIGRRQE